MPRHRITILILSLLLAVGRAAAQQMTADDVIAGHIRSFGPPAALDASRLRMAVGSSTFTIVSTSKTSSGDAVLASDGGDMALFSSFSLRDYRMERIGLFGGKVEIPMVYEAHRSVLGTFLNAYDALLSSRLLGGSIFSTWQLYSADTPEGKFDFAGRKKVGSTDAFVLEYFPRRGLTSGSSIRLYFDTKTFRHIRTVFRQKELDRGFYESMGSRATKGTIPNGWEQDMASNGSTLTEDFDNFVEDAAGIMLPHRYSIELAIDSVKGTAQYQWKFDLREYKLIRNFPPNFFSFTAKS